jgi:hypothetical protein
MSDKAKKTRKASLPPELEPVLDRMCLAGWLEAYLFHEGRGLLFRWTREGAAQARLLKQLRRPIRKSVPIPEHVALSADWQTIRSKADSFGRPMSVFQENFLYYVFINWYKRNPLP